MNLLLIDDHFCTREGISHFLATAYPEVTVYEADSVAEGFEVAERVALNLVMLDVHLPGEDGWSGLRRFKERFPGLSVVMFSGIEDRELVFQALRLGAMGFIPKNLGREAFCSALRDVLSGRPFVPLSALGPEGVTQSSEVLDATSACDGGLRKPSKPADFGLTPREFEVLRELAFGKCNKEIARSLSIAEQTVKNHLKTIAQKFGVSRRVELVVLAYEKGIVFGPPNSGNPSSKA